MKTLLAILLSVVSVSALAQAPIARGPGTTNTPSAWTNIVLLAVAPETNTLNTVLRGALAQTNSSVGSVTNAGTAAYSNMSAFLLSYQTNQPLSQITNAGTAAYSNASDFLLSYQTNQPLSQITNAGTAAYSNASAFALSAAPIASTQNLAVVAFNNNGAAVTNIPWSAVTKTASGAVPLNADSTATTLAQLQTLGLLGSTNAQLYGVTLNGVTTNLGSWVGGILFTNLITGQWAIVTNGNLTLGPTNAAATITLNGGSGVATATSFSGSGTSLTGIPYLAGTNTFTGTNNIAIANVGVAAADPFGSVFSVKGNTATGSIDVYSSQSGASGDAGVNVYSSRGTFASPTATASADRISGLYLGGYNTNWLTGASIEAFANQTWIGSAAGTYLTFKVNANNTTSRTERMRISAAGGVSIGTTTDPSTGNLLVSGSIAGNTVNSSTTIFATNGLASFAAVASVAIDPTGWTNIWSTNNAVIVFGGTAVSSFKKRAGALTATNITYPVFTGNSTVVLQPGQALVTSGTSVTGSADPF